MSESTILITDAELLGMAMGSEALSGIDVAVRDQARSSASAVTLSYVKKRYTLPLIQWGDDLRQAAAKIAAWDLLSRRGFNPGSRSDVQIHARYMTAIKWLEDVRGGDVEPIDIIDSTPSVSEAGPLVATEDTKWKTWRT